MVIEALLHLPKVEKQKIKNMNNLASSDHYFGRHTLAYGREVWVRELVRLLCCVLWQNTFLSQCLSPPGVYMGTNKLSEKLNEMLGGDFVMDWHPI